MFQFLSLSKTDRPINMLAVKFPLLQNGNLDDCLTIKLNCTMYKVIQATFCKMRVSTRNKESKTKIRTKYFITDFNLLDDQ